MPQSIWRQYTGPSAPATSPLQSNRDVLLPPAKRQRLSNHLPPTVSTPIPTRTLGQTLEQKRENLQRCLKRHVYPCVFQAIKEHPQKHLDKHKIGVRVAVTISKGTWFRVRWDETAGNFTNKDEEYIKTSAAKLVNKLAKLPEYHRPLLVPTKSLVETIVIDDDEDDDDDDDDDHKSSLQQSPRATLTSVSPAGGHSRNSSSSRDASTRPIQPTTEYEAVIQEPSTLLTDNEGVVRTRQLGAAGCNHKPYRTFKERRQIRLGTRGDYAGPVPAPPAVYHVDFTEDELAFILLRLKSYLPAGIPPSLESLRRVCADGHSISSLVGSGLRGRSEQDLESMSIDLLAGQFYTGKAVLSLGSEDPKVPSASARESRISTSLFARELVGGFGRTRTYRNLQNDFKRSLEDDLRVVAEFTNCAGDIATATWFGGGSHLICGTTAHSDTHNQQYNKPGNLLLCSVKEGILQAYPDHRIPRPIVAQGENSTEAMRESQDPWLYSSVVSSDYNEHHKFAYTSSFDKTVKVWKVTDAGLTCQATWRHEGNVNFVAAARDGSGRIASAADVPSGAIRIYKVDPSDATVDDPPYQTYSCTRSDATGADWAYYPATMQWGKAPETQHLLLVGYSPRSINGDDSLIPEDKRNSGEIMLIDAEAGKTLPILTATATNVFEVVWHPYLPRFIAGTSPCGLHVQPGTRTQVHIFHYDYEHHAYSEKQNIDCEASDINELTFMPNSAAHAYITAACTDGKVYVWDTSHPEVPLQLAHGQPVDPYLYDREKEDTGVKFMAWGTTLDRFYTGSSDGVVRVWNLRNRENPYVRTLLEAPGPISVGSFSPDFTKLAIGDATGRLYILSVDEEDEHETHFLTLPGTARKVRRPRPFTPHQEPPPPERPEDMAVDQSIHNESIAAYSHRAYLSTAQLIRHPDPTIGVVQGPAYLSSGLFNRDAHLDKDPSNPLVAVVERAQQVSIASARGYRRRSMTRSRTRGITHSMTELRSENLEKQHLSNMKQDMDSELREQLAAQGLVTDNHDWGLAEEESNGEEEDDEGDVEELP